MDNHQENHEETRKLINAVGAVAEMSLVFYRAALGAGADTTEALNLTRAYIAALISSSMDKGKEEPF